jgi:L,D-peptidoglycan transpeptidase YkuD (ErfK/YbiS/YcfS/YnhG family)
VITVRVKNGETQGILTFASKNYTCWVGKEGLVVAADKREGDNKTPVGIFALRGVWVRADKINVSVNLPVTISGRDDGWCDDVNDTANYNKPVKLPYAGSHEVMWRNDDYYDVVIDIDYNRGLIRVGAGSAIFMHIKEEPTAGCVAVSKTDMLEILPQMNADTVIDIAEA